MRDIVINQVKRYIESKGLQVQGIEDNDNGSVRIQTATSNIRSIGLKDFLAGLGINEFRVGYDAVDFFPEADIYSFTYEILTEDPFAKIDDVKANLLTVLGKIIEPEEIEVKQKMGRKVADGTNNFVFTVISSQAKGRRAERAYLEFALPPLTKMKVRLREYVESMEQGELMPVKPDPISDEVAVGALMVGADVETLEAVALDIEDFRQMSIFELEDIKHKLKGALELANKFGLGALAGSIRASLKLVEEVEIERDEPTDD